MNERMTNWYERKGKTCRRHFGVKRLKDTVEVLKKLFYRVDEFNRRGEELEKRPSYEHE